MFLLQTKDLGYIDSVCKNSPELSELSFKNIKTYTDEAIIIEIKPMVDLIDTGIIDNIDKYMCSTQCPCHPDGVQFLTKWSLEDQTLFSDSSKYSFDGTIKNFYECYQKLVQDGNVSEDQKIKDRDLKLIKDFEINMNCIGICETPKFWFFRDYQVGPPSMNCVTSIKNEIDESKGALGYIMAISCGLTLLLLFSLCGICRSKDYCFQQDKTEQETEFVDLEAQKGND